MFNKKNKKGQIGETVTWVVATIIIIVILSISIFASTAYLGKSKKADFSKQTDILASKSFFAYLLTEDAREGVLTEDTEGKIVYEQLRDEKDEKGEENLNDFNGDLALKIFKEFYEEEYSNVWVGTSSIPVSPRTTIVGIPISGIAIYTSNVFFGIGPEHIGREGYAKKETVFSHVRQIIRLNEDEFVQDDEENKYVEMILTRQN